MPRGLLAGTLAALALVWGPYMLIAGSSLISALVQTAVYAGLLVLTVRSRRVKVLVVRPDTSRVRTCADGHVRSPAPNALCWVP
jgi:hypothetical protein